MKNPLKSLLPYIQGCNKNESGLVLPVALITLTVLFILGTAFLSFATESVRFAAKSRDMYQAQMLADSGVEIMISRLNENPLLIETVIVDPKDPVNKPKIDFPEVGGSIIELRIDDSEPASIKSVARVGSSVRTVIAKVKVRRNFPFVMIGTGQDAATIRNNAIIVGDLYYESDVVLENNVNLTGTLTVNGSLTLNNNALGTSNSVVVNAKDVHLSNNAVINGDLHYNGTLIMDNNSRVTGHIFKGDAALAPVSIPALQDPEWYRNHGYIMRNGDFDVPPSSGSSVYDKYYVNGNATLPDYFRGSLVCTGNITGKNEITVEGILFAPNGTVDIQNKFTLNGTMISMESSIWNTCELNYSQVPFPDGYPWEYGVGELTILSWDDH